jgi:phosphoglycolate phosphatase
MFHTSPWSLRIVFAISLRMFHALVFDLDGTLADTLADIASALNAALASVGAAPLELDAVRARVGEGARRLVERALADDAQHLHARALEAFRDIYGRNLLVQTRAYDGIDEVLGELKLAKIPRAVLSNKPHAATCAIVEALFPEAGFTAVLGEREGIPRKPDPTAAFEVSRLLGVRPEGCVFIGDTAIDMHTAAAAGMFPAGVTWGFRPEAELVGSGAKALFRHPRELLELI